MNVKTLDINHPLWLKTLDKLPHDVYHLPKYVALDAKRTKTLPKAFLLEGEECIFFVPYLLRSCTDVNPTSQAKIYDVVSPYGYPGILVCESGMNKPGFVDFAWQKFERTLRDRNVCSAFLRLHPILNEKIGITSKMDLQDNGSTISIDLTLDEDRIWAKTRRGHQSTINKCIRLGFTARTVSFTEYIDEFIAIYEETMDRVLAEDVYYFSREYFTELSELGNKIHLGIVESESEIICACLFFESCGIVQAHLGGTKTEFLKYSPFNLLLHHMRLWAKDRGNRYLHMGGGVNGKKDDLYTFKSGFSKQRHQFFTLRSIVNDSIYNDLLKSRAKLLSKTIEELNASQFFPAYRTIC